MHNELERESEEIIGRLLHDLGRPDLFRQPLVSFSDASDGRYLDLKNLIGDWHLTPSELLSDAQSVISYFVPFTKKVAVQADVVENGSPLWSEAYVVINQHFEIINEAISHYLLGLGYSVATIPATHTYDPADLKSMWSHKSAAVIAGLGDFGTNRLVITEKGSAGRFCSVITSAVLQSDKPPVENKCLSRRGGSCDLCFRVCPPQALAPDSFDRFACHVELKKNESKMRDMIGLSADICGKCISVCPFAYIA